MSFFCVINRITKIFSIDFFGKAFIIKLSKIVFERKKKQSYLGIQKNISKERGIEIMKFKNPKIQNLRKRILIVVAILTIIVTALLVILECTNSNFSISKIIDERNIFIGKTQKNNKASSSDSITINTSELRSGKIIYSNKPQCKIKSDVDGKKIGRAHV